MINIVRKAPMAGSKIETNKFFSAYLEFKVDSSKSIVSISKKENLLYYNTYTFFFLKIFFVLLYYVFKNDEN